MMNLWITLIFFLLLTACGPAGDGAPLSRTVDEAEPFRAHNLTIFGYNYTDRAIGSFEVNGAGGGNLMVSSPTSGGGGHVCCASFYTPMQQDFRVHIKWTHDDDRWCETEVPVSEPIPAKPEYMEVHFYPDGHIEVAVTEDASPPRLQLDAAGPGWRHAERSRNKINDERFAKCKHGYR